MTIQRTLVAEHLGFHCAHIPAPAYAETLQMMMGARHPLNMLRRSTLTNVADRGIVWTMAKLRYRIRQY